jgi:uncharacterized OB-fold protein
VNEEQLQRDVGELTRSLTNDGHEIEHITPEKWKALIRKVRGSDEEEKWFENFLDTDLYAVQRCKACGRAFLVLKVKDNSGALMSWLVTDEEGDQIDPGTEVPCLVNSSQQ